MTAKTQTKAAKKPSKQGIEVPSSKYYVYALIDGRKDSVFYIGKGCRRRMFQHENDAKRGKTGPTKDRIRDILSCGCDVQYRILGQYESEKEALAAEREFIADNSGLTNLTKGGEAGGTVTPKERIRREAERMLSALAPFELWESRLPEAWKIAVTGACGSLRAFYDVVRDGLVRDSVDPAPNVAFRGECGNAMFGWE